MVKILHNGKSIFSMKAKRRRPIPKAKRRAIWIKHMGTHIFTARCLSCGSTPIDPFSFESGHIIAHSKGGSDSIDNLVPICSICNRDMGTMDMRLYMRKQFNRILKHVLEHMKLLNHKLQKTIDK